MALMMLTTSNSRGDEKHQSQQIQLLRSRGAADAFSSVRPLADRARDASPSHIGHPLCAGAGCIAQTGQRTACGMLTRSGWSSGGIIAERTGSVPPSSVR